MTATLERATQGTSGASRGGQWTGTAGLLRLNLRLDRLRIAIWTVATGLLVVGSVASLEESYPTAESLQARAALMSNPATVVMTGPAFGLDDYTFGAMVANELSLYVYLAAAIMSILLVVRHTRAEEETGRTEVVRALPVGRFAAPAAAALTVAAANLAVGAAVTLGLVGTGLEAADSVAMGAGAALTGMVFAGIAAVTAQLTEHARAASGGAMAVLAAAFLVRGVGDVLDAQGSWLSWFSPFAWAQQTRLYVDLRWWPLAVSAVVTVVLLAVAVALAQRRDVGAGLRPPTPGPAAAAPRLLSPGGLAWRLLRGGFTAWTVSTFFFAVAFGSLSSSLEEAFEDIPELAEWIALEGGDLTTGFASAILSFLVVAPVIFVVQSVLRLRAEEEAGRSALVLATGSSRAGLLGGWLATVAVQVVAMTLAVGLGVGLGVASGTGDWSWVWRLTLAALVYLPAVALVGGLAVLLLGLLPRRAGLTWLVVVWVCGVLFLGSLLNLPQWATELSPITHTPSVPQEDVAVVPLLVLTVLAAVLVAGGFAGLRRRDVIGT